MNPMQITVTKAICANISEESISRAQEHIDHAFVVGTTRVFLALERQCRKYGKEQAEIEFVSENEKQWNRLADRVREAINEFNGFDINEVWKG